MQSLITQQGCKRPEGQSSRSDVM